MRERWQVTKAGGEGGQFLWRVLTISAVLPLLYLNQSIIYLFSKEKTIIDKYNELKLNKTNRTLKNNLAYYLL